MRNGRRSSGAGQRLSIITPDASAPSCQRVIAGEAHVRVSTARLSGMNRSASTGTAARLVENRRLEEGEGPRRLPPGGPFSLAMLTPPTRLSRRGVRPHPSRPAARLRRAWTRWTWRNKPSHRSVPEAGRPDYGDRRATGVPSARYAAISVEPKRRLAVSLWVELIRLKSAPRLYRGYRREEFPPRRTVRCAAGPMKMAASARCRCTLPTRNEIGTP